MTMDWLEHISVILPDSFFQVHLIPDFHSAHIQYALLHFLQAQCKLFIRINFFVFLIVFNVFSDSID